jgi:protein-S-isoprenylcysteine O-methyltransferase Ste14
MADKQRAMITSLPAILTSIGAVVLLVLAAIRWRDNGWGAMVWFAAFIAMSVVRMPHGLRNRANVVVEVRKDRTEVALLAGMFLAMMVLPLIHLATGLFAFADYALPEWATWIGAVLQIPFLWLFWRSHADLGRNWSPGLEVREDHALVTNGVYAYIRHPMYAAIWISALAQPLLVHNWIAGFPVVPAFAAMWFIRVPNEEALMRLRFGAVYDDYCRKAGRLFPHRLPG